MFAYTQVQSSKQDHHTLWDVKWQKNRKGQKGTRKEFPEQSGLQKSSKNNSVFKSRFFSYQQVTLEAGMQNKILKDKLNQRGVASP